MATLPLSFELSHIDWPINFTVKIGMFEAMIGLLLLGCFAFMVKYWQLFKIYKKNKQLKELTAMNWRDFERYIAQTLKRKGWTKVQVNKGVKDGGYDVSGFVNWKFCIVQCKRYKINASIGVKPVRELFGVAKSIHAQGLFVATCGFTKEAKKFAYQNKIRIRDKKNIVEQTKV